MYHDIALARPTGADPRPRSAVSAGVGLAGLAGMGVWMAIAIALGMDGPYAALVNVAACAVPMLLWSVLVDKVHRRASTGLDWANPRPLRETFDTSLTRLAGLWLTWGGIAAIYAVGRFWWTGQYADYPFAMWCFAWAAPVLFLLSVPYTLWIDRYLVEPRDGAWALGAWLMGLGGPADRAAIAGHLRSWGVKAFFLPFMLSIVPGGFGHFVAAERGALLGDPVALANWLITLMFVIDVGFATAGYILTLRPLDSHIRSASPLAGGWAVALICYPPFLLMSDGGPLDYHHNTAEWSWWFAGHPLLLAAAGAVLVALTAIYAWATVAFGIRFSNLTNRGIVTGGPYAWSRHPAYLSKNLFWWLVTLPMLATSGDWVDSLRNCALLACVSTVYWLRARTEERHLMADPDYAAYHAWMARRGPVPRFFAWVAGAPRDGGGARLHRPAP